MSDLSEVGDLLRDVLKELRLLSDLMKQLIGDVRGRPWNQP